MLLKIITLLLIVLAKRAKIYPVKSLLFNRAAIVAVSIIAYCLLPTVN